MAELLSAAGRSLRDREDPLDGPSPTFADNLSASMRRRLDARASSMAARSRRPAATTRLPRKLAIGLAAAVLVSGLAYARGFLPPIQSAGANPSASATLPQTAAVETPTPELTQTPSTTPGETPVPVVPPPSRSATPSPTPTPTPSPTPTPTATHRPSPTARPTQPPTPKPTEPPATPTPSPSPSAGIVDLGNLSAADNPDLTVSFSWNAYTGPNLYAYTVVHELSGAGKTPGFPASPSWGSVAAGTTHLAVAGIGPGTYLVRVVAVCAANGQGYVCGQTNVIQIHLSAGRGATPTPTA